MAVKCTLNSEYVKRVDKLSNTGLTNLEVRLTNWLADVKRFYPMPALEQSIAKDLEIVWQEQKLRGLQRKHKADMEFGINNAGRFRPGIVQNTRTGKLETNLPDPSQQ